jgi:DNA-binding transcriptional LysR family regulator
MEVGIAFDERALRAITGANEAEAATQGAGTGLEGRLRMCAPVTFARLHVVPKLGAFLEAHPKLRLELVMADRPMDLAAEHIDATLVARKLTPGERFVVASPAYLVPRGVPRTPAELRAHAAIIDDQSAGSEEWGSANTVSRGSVMAAVN